MRMLYVAAAAATFAATPAFAQDAAPAFSGGHVEAIGGYDSISGGGDSESGVAFGIAGGYDFRSGGAVFGIEAEAAESTIEDAGVEAGRDLYIGGRRGGGGGGRGGLFRKAGDTNAPRRVAG